MCLEWVKGVTATASENEAVTAPLSELPFEMVGVACHFFQWAGLSCLSAKYDET